MHDAIGFRNTRTNMEYTMEWYELGKFFLSIVILNNENN